MPVLLEHRQAQSPCPEGLLLTFQVKPPPEGRFLRREEEQYNHNGDSCNRIRDKPVQKQQKH